MKVAPTTRLHAETLTLSLSVIEVTSSSLPLSIRRVSAERAKTIDSYLVHINLPFRPPSRMRAPSNRRRKVDRHIPDSVVGAAQLIAETPPLAPSHQAYHSPGPKGIFPPRLSRSWSWLRSSSSDSSRSVGIDEWFTTLSATPVCHFINS
jgi:hypothetical protein